MENSRIKQIIDTKNVLITVAATGAGARGQGLLWDTPGASAVFNGGYFPYATEETDSFLGLQPTKYVSKETALQLAMRSYMKSCETLELRLRKLETAAEIKEEEVKKLGACIPIGIGLTASVASLREHRGDHGVHAAFITPTEVRYIYFRLPKGVGDLPRQKDGKYCDWLIRELVVESCGLPSIIFTNDVPQEELRELFLQHPYVSSTGKRSEKVPLNGYHLVRVTANPLHEGHVGMALSAENLLGGGTVFLITACAAPGGHKPPPSAQDMLRRAAMVMAASRFVNAICGVYFSNTALFAEMFQQHNYGMIAVGADALDRALDPKWLGSVEATKQHFMECALNGGAFLVYDRPPITAESVKKKAIELYGLPSYFFYTRTCHWDVSSSKLRALRGW